MPKFSENSKAKLATAHPKLQEIFNEVIKHRDCTIVWGYRNKEQQDKCFNEGTSRLRFPDSDHNKVPSLACDVPPWPSLWADKKELELFGHFVMGLAAGMRIKLYWGGDWLTFKDWAHFYIKE